MTDHRIPIHVVTGFLGAGKSTLLNALLRRPELADTALIVMSSAMSGSTII